MTPSDYKWLAMDSLKKRQAVGKLIGKPISDPLVGIWVSVLNDQIRRKQQNLATYGRW